MSVKLETPVYKTEVVKVSNMDAVNILNDDSLFLVIQDGFAHKISAKSLKESIYSAAQKQLDEFFKRYLKKQKESKDEFAQLSSECLDLAESFGKTIQRKNVAKHKETQQYIETTISELSSEINEWEDGLFDVVSKDLEKNTTQLSTYIESYVNSAINLLSTELLETCSSISAKIAEEKLNNESMFESFEKSVSDQIENHKKLVNNNYSKISDVQQQLSVNLSQTSYDSAKLLSAAIDEFDKKLYGLTVEEIQDDFSIVNHTLLSGDINILSTEISTLKQKYDSLLNVVNELKTSIIQ